MVISPGWLGARGRVKVAAREASGRITREALCPVWYEDCGGCDTFEGRAGMVTVIMSLACDRLAAIGRPQARHLTRRINELILDGFDAAFRELGVGDHSIARKVRALAEAHAGLGRALMPALATCPDDGPDPVGAVLLRNGVVTDGGAGLMTARLRQVQSLLRTQADAEILAGQLAIGLPAQGSQRS